ncbi:MAG: hypothetical protein GAK38_01497 [Xylophilus sp.]|nr:MAG: hypothetical protein GAK38_01497 [Xylophilus sp.]
MGAGVQEFLTGLLDAPATQRDLQDRRDAWTLYQQHHQDWIDHTAAAWRRAGTQAPAAAAAPAAPVPGDRFGFSLVEDDVVENRIAASRIAQGVAEKLDGSFDELRLRMRRIEGADLPADDLLRVEPLVQLLVESWVAVGLPRTALALVAGGLQRDLASLLGDAYRVANGFLADAGVEARHDLRASVRRSGPSTAVGALASGGAAGLPAAPAPLPARTTTTSGGLAAAPGRTMPAPLARARQRAQGVIGQLRRLLDQAGGAAAAGTSVDPTRAQPLAPASAALAQALAPRRERQGDLPSGGGTLIEDWSPQGIARAATAVRATSAELKQKTGNASEKAIIEVVALMFQSILTEKRIPPNVRVWFSRLQLPVLRVALAEPEDFFSTLDHPARQLIDRMGSCVLGFDSHAISGSALETEIRRVVQVIEQYPETGRRVFQLVHDEFQKFLARFLTEKQSTRRLVGVAQQVEQKETLAVQYTIELRRMLEDMSVRDDVRDFLFKVWAEVLALSAVRLGPRHEDTLALRQAAADLVWAAGAKPSRADRARVIADLPGLLQRLRRGLGLLGVSEAAQEVQIKRLSETLADAFMSRTEAIPQARIDAMARRLAHLEDFIDDAATGELPLDAASLELLLGDDAENLRIIAEDGAPVDGELVAWALDLVPGTWFTLRQRGAARPCRCSTPGAASEPSSTCSLPPTAAATWCRSSAWARCWAPGSWCRRRRKASPCAPRARPSRRSTRIRSCCSPEEYALLVGGKSAPATCREGSI